MRLAIVGCGSIGRKLAEAADGMTEVQKIYLSDLNGKAANQLVSELKKALAVNSVEEKLYNCDLVIEAASQAAAKEIIPKVVGRGVDIMVMSVGALVDDGYRDSVYGTAKNNRARILVPSGAICGTDGLSSAVTGRIDEVELTTTKGYDSLIGIPYLNEKGIDIRKIDKPTVIYRGTAREAVKLFPKNMNVAATVSIMGVGFDRTKVTVIFDPETHSNSHELVLRGEFGEMVAKTKNIPSPDNPSTSHLAAMSAISALKRIIKNEWVGI